MRPSDPWLPLHLLVLLHPLRRSDLSGLLLRLLPFHPLRPSDLWGLLRPSDPWDLLLR